MDYPCSYAAEPLAGNSLQDRSGTYLLALWLSDKRVVRVGRLGLVEFPRGWYAYVGSALGPGGIQARLRRHRRRLSDPGQRGPAAKRAHWHVDYLREEAAWGGAWGRSGAARLECAWAAALSARPGASIAAVGFGASDCGCRAHLVHLPQLPADEWLASTLGAERIWMGDDELDELIQVLVSGGDDAREATALALGRFGPAAAKPLIGLLAAVDPDSRWWAARALAEVGGEEGGQALTGALSDVEPDVRACAALALGRIGERGGGQVAQSALDALAARLADESAFVAGIAADALSMIGEPAVGALIRMLADPHPHARLLAVRALGRTRAPEAVSPLCGALEDPSYLVCYQAQDALEALGVGMVYFSP